VTTVGGSIGGFEMQNQLEPNTTGSTWGPKFIKADNGPKKPKIK